MGVWTLQLSLENSSDSQPIQHWRSRRSELWSAVEEGLGLGEGETNLRDGSATLHNWRLTLHGSSLPQEDVPLRIKYDLITVLLCSLFCCTSLIVLVLVGLSFFPGVNDLHVTCSSGDSGQFLNTGSISHYLKHSEKFLAISKDLYWINHVALVSTEFRQFLLFKIAKSFKNRILGFC